MAILRDSALPQEDISLWRRLFPETFFNPSLFFPGFWELWTGVITRYHLYELVHFAQWVIIVGIPNDSAIKTPIDLAHLNCAEIHAFGQAHDNQGNLVLLWRSALCWRGGNPLDRIDFSLEGNEKLGNL